MKPRIEIYRGRDGDWYARVRAANARIVWSTEGYKRRAGALNAVAFVQDFAKGLPVVHLPAEAGQA